MSACVAVLQRSTITNTTHSVTFFSNRYHQCCQGPLPKLIALITALQARSHRAYAPRNATNTPPQPSVSARWPKETRRRNQPVPPQPLALELSVPPPALALASANCAFFRLCSSAIHLLPSYTTTKRASVSENPDRAPRQHVENGAGTLPTDILGRKEKRGKFKNEPDFLSGQFSLGVVDPATAFGLVLLQPHCPIFPSQSRQGNVNPSALTDTLKSIPGPNVSCKNASMSAFLTK